MSQVTWLDKIDPRVGVGILSGEHDGREPRANGKERLAKKKPVCERTNATGGTVLTEEMDSEYIRRLHEEFNSLKAETKNLNSEVAKLRAKNKRLQQAVDLSTKHLSPVVTPKRTRHSTRLPHLKAV